ncbi:MAG: hypothetical protein ABIB93_00600 [Chloroflexota bacterium]
MAMGVTPFPGEKTIKLTIYLFTDNIAEKKGNIVKKHAWKRGTVCLQKNESHGIKGTSGKNLNSWKELSTCVDNVLSEQNIILQ